MSSTSSKIIGEIAPWAILGVGAILLIKNPAIIGQAINWLFNAVPGGGQQGQGGAGGGSGPIQTINVPYLGNTQAVTDPNLLSALSLLLGTPNPNWWPQPTPTPTPAPAPSPGLSPTYMAAANQAFQGTVRTNSLLNMATFSQQLKTGDAYNAPVGSVFTSTAKPLTPGWFPRKVQTSSVPLTANNANGSVKTTSMYPSIAEARKLILFNPVNRAAALRDPMYGIAYP